MNRLSSENSLYLKQHANNPVDWYPWGEAAFAKARETDKPMLISIGYSSCHWCHVMAHESFEDSYIAKLMNTHFVCVKVDREEHPDVDRIYMESVQMMNGHGGWPLNVFCLPNGRPFAGGTYFPPDDSKGYSLVPWPQLLTRVSDFFKRKRHELEENAEAILGNLQAANSVPLSAEEAVRKEHFFQALDALLESADDDFGGFGDAPKFPPSMALDFLLSMRATATVELMNPDRAEAIDQTVCKTLRAMALGGLFDQIGGGFARYSVDRHWHIPHFEKMLYDNALLLRTYTLGWLRYRDPLFASVVAETIEFLQREMKLPSGAFASALDADSEGGEGAYYIWSPNEVREILGDEAEAFCEAYCITEDGNFEDSGKSLPMLVDGRPAERDRWATARQQLREIRSKRPAPARDDKAIVGWNALLATALAEAGFAFDRKDWMEEAESVCRWVQKGQMEQSPAPHLQYGDNWGGRALLDDASYTVQAYLTLAARIEWIRPGSSQEWIESARSSLAQLLTDFEDPQASGYFYTARDHANPVHRGKEWMDHATPSGNSVLLGLLADFALLDPEGPWQEHYQQLEAAFSGVVERAPHAACRALESMVNQATGIARISIPEAADWNALQTLLSQRPWRRVFLLPGETNQYQLCVGTSCNEPTADPAATIDKL